MISESVVGKRAYISQLGNQYCGDVVSLAFDPAGGKFFLLVDLDAEQGLKSFVVNSATKITLTSNTRK